MSKPSDVIFFLGAGASVKAKVPDTFGLVDRFRESLAQKPDDLKAIEKILEVLRDLQKEQDAEGKVDVELLLETIERLDTKDQDVLLRFHIIKEYALSGYAQKKPLKDQLKNFIKTSGIVNSTNVRYLEPLLSFLVETRPLDIFSVNYDTCVEQFCSIYEQNYVDGFDLHWNSKNFQRDDVDVRLYKIHGSILWYRTDRGDYVKMPIKTDEASMELMTGERVATLMLYPMRKWEYAEPFLELLVKLKEMLEKAKFVIVVGYSFRDDYITRIFWDAARRNKDLIMIFVSPSSSEIYENRLKDYRTPELPHDFSSDFEHGSFDAYFPSSLSGRVLCLPFKFEDILPLLKNRYLKELKEGLTAENAQREMESRGELSSWAYCLRHFISCQYMDKVAEVAPKIDWNELRTSERWLALEIEFGALLSCLAVGREAEAKQWLERFLESMSHYSVQHVKVDVSEPNRIGLNFQLDDGSILLFGDLARQLERILTAWAQLPKVSSDSRAKKIGNLMERVKDFVNYLSPWKERWASREQYAALRQMNYPELTESFRQENAAMQKAATAEGFEKMRTIVQEIEGKELERVLSGQTFQLSI